MLDTNTVNFAIDKMSSALQGVAPHIQNVSAEYVKYVVTKSVLEAAIMVLVLLVGTVLFSVGFRIGQKEDWGSAVGWVFAIIGGIVVLVGLIGVPVEGYEAVLAIWYPDMYVIQSIIAAAN